MDDVAHVHPGQPFCLRMLSALLDVMGDPDASFPTSLEAGAARSQDLLEEELNQGFIQEVPSLEAARSRWQTVAMGRLGFVSTPPRPPRLVLDSSISGVNEATSAALPNTCHLPSIGALLKASPQQLGSGSHIGFPSTWPKFTSAYF